MSVPTRFVLQQGPVLAALARTAATVVGQRFRSPEASAMPTVPGREFAVELPPRPADLVAAYVRHVGGNPSTYRDHLPPHFFPQWGFGPASRTLVGLPYPLARAMNGGSTVEVRAPLPIDEPLTVTAQIVNIDDDGYRAIIDQRIVSGTASVPEAIEAHLLVFIPLKKREGGKGKKRKTGPTVPGDAQEIGFWKLRSDAGLDFAKLTGDFNPVHWITAAARASGFRNTILHGYATMARSWEGLNQNRYKGGGDIRRFEARFTRPLVLPARVGLYTAEVDGQKHVWVGDAPGGTAYMTATYET